jgi:hypothetical protein
VLAVLCLSKDDADDDEALIFGAGIAPGCGPFRGFALTNGFLPSNKWFIATGGAFVIRVPPPGREGPFPFPFSWTGCWRVHPASEETNN